MRRWIGATAVAVALVTGAVGVPAAVAIVNDFGATCASSTSSSFVAQDSTKGVWYAFSWRSGYAVAAYGYIWVPVADVGLTIDDAYFDGATYKWSSGDGLMTPSDPTPSDGKPLKFGVVRGKWSTKYSYIDCT